MTQKMIDALKAAIEAEKAKLLAELSQTAEPQLSAIRKEIEARELLLERRIDRAPPDRARRRLTRPSGNCGRFLLGASKRNCDVERNAIPRHLELRAMVGRGDIHRGS